LTGVVMALLGAESGAGYAGTPGTVAWANINAVSGGSTNQVTLSGVTGAMSVSATNSGPSTLYYTLGDVSQAYSGAFSWPEGQTLLWYVIGGGSGTVTVTNASAGVELSAFTYVITEPTGVRGAGGGGDLP
jgi:hypothetical protein